MEPLLTAVTDSVATGYQALEHVLEGLRESLRLQTGSAARVASPARKVPPARRRAAHPPAGGPTIPAGIVQDLAAIIAEGLGLAGTLVEDVAHAIAESAPGPTGAECLPALALTAPPGGTAKTQFTVWNTGPTLLTKVELSASDLIGAGLRIPEQTVEFAPSSIPQIGPGKGETVEISVPVPPDTPAGLCRGVVMASPGDACAVLALTITNPRRSITVRPIEAQAPTQTRPPDSPERPISVSDPPVSGVDGPS
jgi:hypothetical protein